MDKLGELLSIQVGRPQTRPDPDDPTKVWTSGIYKMPIYGAIWVGELNLAGDGQHHKKFHGGPYRAVLGYSAAHYPRWREIYQRDFPFGAFGENFTIKGLDEDTVCLGDIYQVGDVVRLQVAQPRTPCDQIDKRWGIKGLSDKVRENGWGGWYMRVLQSGEVSAGAPIYLLERSPSPWTIRQLIALRNDHHRSPLIARELAECEALEPSWRRIFAKV